MSDRTNAKIPELLQSDAVSPATSLILTNAIYLKAAWEVPVHPGGHDGGTVHKG